MITRHIRAGGRLLDVGCGTGDFLSEMQQQRGWSVMGLEPARHAARYAHDEEGLSVLAGVLNQAPLADQSFDAITFWDVLEHVYHPRAVIAEAARLLRPGGVLVINHPNIESLDRRIFGRYWLGYELPRHLYLFPAALLRQLMAEQGLYEVEQRCLYGSYSATISSLQFLLSEYLGRSHSDRLVNQVLLSMPLRFLAAPIFGVIDRQGLGSNITVVFRKRHELSRVGCDDTGFYV
jgi:ubiquinone/menaquinone biosynthesis C-methylase UbiE